MQIKTLSFEDNTRPTFCQNVRNYFNEYCKSTSIHGLKFLGERGRCIIERIWWLATILVSLYFCVLLILQAYRKWDLSPVVVSFATSETPVWKIPFPAITICPQIKAHRYLVNYTNLIYMKKKNQTLTKEENNQLLYMYGICSKNGIDLKDDLSFPDMIDGTDLLDFLMKVHPSINSTIKDFYWSGKDYRDELSSLLTPILTVEGICYVFNMIDRNELLDEKVIFDHYNKYNIGHQRGSQWSKDKGYSPEADSGAYPKRSAVAGAYGGLDITFSFNSSDMDYVCGDGLEGFKIILHNPIQIPSVKSVYFRLGVNQDVTVALKPNLMTTSNQLKRYPPEQRKCYFEEEKKLKFFKIYDQYNCIHECLSNFTLMKCGCVSFNMFRDNSTPVCGPRKSKCVMKFSYLFLQNQINSENGIVGGSVCYCYPSCFSLGFEAEISQTEWKWKEGLVSAEDDLQSKKGKLQFITSERHELFGQMEFLASCGGLLGLFIGFSFISVMEIFYFLTLRFFCNLRNFGKDYWSGKNYFLENRANFYE